MFARMPFIIIRDISGCFFKCARLVNGFGADVISGLQGCITYQKAKASR